ncbi:MAG: glycosyltransferase, partial [Nanoarchaeota archaeon]|nr:glycosyltransferase [Nanoarchaeota archaeon]
MMTEASIILPCRDEERSIEKVITQALRAIKKSHLDAEIIVSDSSKDKSPSIAKRLNAKLVSHKKTGYGNACLEGIKAASG